MRKAETILSIIQQRGKQKLPLNNIYRQLYNSDLYLRAYNRLYRNKGAMTPGTTKETVDGMSLAKIDTIIAAIRKESYQWKPVRRILIPKKSGKFRPLGLPTWSDKILQEVIRSILEAYYEPQFSKHSHGFRPNKGCHTALDEITKHWRGVKWYIEGDISQCFDNLDQQILLSILREDFHDNRFLRLISNLFKAGYLEDWKYHLTLNGVPQGGVVSPILSNIYLDRLDKFVEQKLLPTYNYGNRRKPNPPYVAILQAARKERKSGKWETARKLRQQAQQMPSRDPGDPNFRRLWYVRYADDWILGFSGPRNEAEQIKSELCEFLRNKLTLELSREKTLITNARTEAAHFLGYEIINQNANDKHCREYKRRCINGATGLKVPVEVIRNKCSKYMKGGKASPRVELRNDTDYSIISLYQSEYRGIVQYYLKAFNVCRLNRLYNVMKLSLAKTLATKYKISVKAVMRKYKTTVTTLYGSRRVIQVVIQRGDSKKPLIARFGGIELRRRKHAVIDPHKIKPYDNQRSEILQRLLADQCELCGSEDDCEVHHIRKLADIDRPGQKEKPQWVKRMIARHRKTLVVCRKCHVQIHQGKYSGHKLPT